MTAQANNETAATGANGTGGRTDGSASSLLDRPMVVQTESTAGGGIRILRNGKPYLTPRGAELRLESAALAAVVAGELQAAGWRGRLTALPITQLAVTAQDRVAPNREAVVTQILNYLDTDLLCYRAESPVDLAARQRAQWQPLLDWMNERFRIELMATAGLAPLRQSESARGVLMSELERLPPAQLTALAALVQACGSLVLGLAVIDGALDAESAFNTSLLDELYQAERWGSDEEAQQRRDRLRQDIHLAARFLALANERHLHPDRDATTSEGIPQ